MKKASARASRNHNLRRMAAILLAGVTLIGAAGSAAALSELKQIGGQPAQAPVPTAEDVPGSAPASGSVTGIPDPDPLISTPNDDPNATSGVEEAPEDQGPPPEVIYDIEKAPEPVRKLRQLIIEAAASGDIERLKPLLNIGPNQTQVMLDSADPDPIATLKGLSGDSEGVEILAILLDVLSTGFVHVNAGTPDEMYVWPYFAEKPLATLTPPEKVELFRIVTAGDFTDMQESGNYNFFRVGISPDGQWKFFTAGD